MVEVVQKSHDGAESPLRAVRGHSVMGALLSLLLSRVDVGDLVVKGRPGPDVVDSNGNEKPAGVLRELVV